MTSFLAAVAISSCFWRGFVLCFAVRWPGPADELTVTFRSAKGTSVYTATFPLGTSFLVKGTTVAGVAGSCARGTIVTIALFSLKAKHLLYVMSVVILGISILTEQELEQEQVLSSPC